MAEGLQDGTVGAALGSAVTAGVAGFWSWVRNRNRLDDAQASAMIRKLWGQNERLAAKVEEMHGRLDVCQEQHRECEVKHALLQREVAELRRQVEAWASERGAR